jgi:hypothetical protein
MTQNQTFEFPQQLRELAEKMLSRHVRLTVS